MTRPRAVSDLLGFALVFGIVVVSIGLIYTGGIAAVDDLQHDHAMTNADRAFDVLAGNVEDIHRHGAPARSTELTFAGGEMRAVEGDPLVVRVTATVDEAEVANETFVATPIAYTSRATAFHYAGGAVVRTDRSSSAIVRDPPFRFAADRTVLSFVSTTAEGGRTLGGTGTVRVAALDRGSSVPAVVAPADDPVTLSISVTSPRYRAWAVYLERQGLVREAVDADAETVTFSHETDALALRRTLVAVTVSS